MFTSAVTEWTAHQLTTKILSGYPSLHSRWTKSLVRTDASDARVSNSANHPYTQYFSNCLMFEYM